MLGVFRNSVALPDASSYIQPSCVQSMDASALEAVEHTNKAIHEVSLPSRCLSAEHSVVVIVVGDANIRSGYA